MGNLDAVLGSDDADRAKAAADAARQVAVGAVAAAAVATQVRSCLGGYSSPSPALTQPMHLPGLQKKDLNSAAGTPYANPGGRWSQFKSYSTFQRTFDIWSFAFKFFWRLFQVNSKFSYGEQALRGRGQRQSHACC